MVRQVGVLNCTAVGPGSNLDGGAGIFFSFTTVLLWFGWYLCHRSTHLKNAHINHYKNNYRLVIINPFHSNNLSLFYHSSVFLIFPVSEAVFLRSFGGMSECNIFGIVFNTHTCTDTLFVAQVHHCFLHVCFIMF